MGAGGKRPSWVLVRELLPWQRDALEAWERALRHGVVEAATGTGKTLVALAAMARLHEEIGDNLRVAIIVPTVVLARQWRTQLENQMNIDRRHIGELHSAAELEYSSQPILLTVANTAREFLYAELELWNAEGRDVLLVADECHRLGSDSNSLALDGEYAFSLGLSATPERDDAGHIHYVYPALGPPIFRFPLREALNSGTLSPLMSVNLYVDFEPEERGEWETLSQDIGKAFASLAELYPGLLNAPGDTLMTSVARLAKASEPIAARILMLVTQRRQLVSNAQKRSDCLVEVLQWLRRHKARALVFHETQAAAQETCDQLLAWGVRAGLEHSGLRRVDRDRAFADFSTGTTRVLVAVRALDEGVDVPEASVAVVAAGSRSRRQRIQRLGRVLRRVDGKTAIAISILVRDTPEESAVGGADADLLGDKRVRHHRWPMESDIEAMLGGAMSTYSPERSHRQTLSAADELTVSELGLREPRRQRSVPVLRGENPFSVNGWHEAEQVRQWLAVDQRWFDNAIASTRHLFINGLDPVKAADKTVVHGTEVEALIRYHDEDGRTHAPRTSEGNAPRDATERRVISSRRPTPSDGA